MIHSLALHPCTVCLLRARREIQSCPWEFHNQVGEIRLANNHFKPVQGKTRRAGNVRTVAQSRRWQEKNPALATVPHWALPAVGAQSSPSCSQKPGSRPGAARQGHCHQQGCTQHLQDLFPLRWAIEGSSYVFVLRL